MPYSGRQDEFCDQHEQQNRAESETLIAPVVQAAVDEMRKGNLLLALDRDGTLAAIADRPEEAKVDDEVVQALRQIGMFERISLAFVSARSIAQLQGDFAEVNAIFAGNYGMEIRFRPDETLVQPAASAAIEHLRSARDGLARFTTDGINAVLEDHGYSLCLHWHTVPKERRQELHEEVAKEKQKFPDLYFKELPTSYEVLPLKDWNKGRALEQIDERLRADGRDISGFMYVGDSDPDEPAFEWVNRKGGTSVRVGSAGSSTVSKLQLSGTMDVRRVLQHLAKLASSSGGS